MQETSTTIHLLARHWKNIERESIQLSYYAAHTTTTSYTFDTNGFIHVSTSPKYPQSNRAAERAVNEKLNMRRGYVHGSVGL